MKWISLMRARSGNWWTRYPALGRPRNILVLIVLVGLIIAAGFLWVHAREKAARVQWLRENAVAVRTIDPDDEEDSDLLPLAQRIGTARVVALGEPMHGAGASFRAKARLARFLHQKMGFDVLALEAGLFDCHLAEEVMRRDKTAKAALGRDLFGIWTRSREARPLFHYLATTHGTAHPLEVAGFDCNFSSAHAAENFGPMLVKFFDDMDPALLTDDVRHVVRAPGDWWQATRRPTSREYETYRTVLENVLSILSQARPALAKKYGAQDVAFQERNTKNALVYAQLMAMEYPEEDGKPTANHNVRDTMMARNLLWLVQDRYPGRKIIVWGATQHLIHNGPSIERVGSAVKSYQGWVFMGQEVHEALGDQLYTIACTAYHGRLGFGGQKPYELWPAPSGSLESLFHETGWPHLFVDLRGPRQKSGHWLCTPQLARPLGFGPQHADWSGVFDAFFFTDEEEPVTWDLNTR
jgi:erythromycin esterase